MAPPSTTYEPRRPALGVLYQVVREHVETFRAQAAEAGGDQGLPVFVEREFRDFLRCGSLAGGFARFHCAGCGADRLVPFSCRRRTVCPSCAGRRMAERAAHLHALVIDGVFTSDGDTVRFQPCAVDTWADDAPVLAGLAAASVEGRVALGGRHGHRVRREGAEGGAFTARPASRSCHARHAGFDLHAALTVPADQRDRLERVCRYTLRPPVAQERLQWTPDGQVRLALRRPWSDGTTHLVFEPIELLERLAALTPRPRVNLILYHGVLGARAAWRSEVVRFGVAPEADEAPGAGTIGAHVERSAGRNYVWAELMRRTLGLDVLRCQRCGSRMRLVALIEEPPVVQRILSHLGLPTDMPRPRPARSPPTLATLGPHVVVDGTPDDPFIDDPA